MMVSDMPDTRVNSPDLLLRFSSCTGKNNWRTLSPMIARATLPALDTLNYAIGTDLFLPQHPRLAGREEEILVQRDRLHGKDEKLRWRRLATRGSTTQMR